MDAARRASTDGRRSAPRPGAAIIEAPRAPRPDAATFDAARRALRDAAADVPHTDADGLAAGAIALRARGERAGDAVLLGRGETPFAADAPLPDGPLAILDWGVRPIDRPALLVDHHAFDTDAAGAAVTVVSSFGEDPEVPTAPLMRRIVPDAPAWLAAVGGVGDAGDAAFALPECAGAPKTAVRKLVPLVNAPRRLPDGPVRTALALLTEHDDPKHALADPRIAELHQAKAAWRAEFDRVVRTAPDVSARLAVLRFSTPAQVHPLVATAWARRLAPRVVLAANDDYLPGRVNFAVRGGVPGQDLRALLRSALPEQGGEFAHGHPRATGGSLEPPAFERLLAALSS
ncbi:MAG TPA: DHH family phosphoesterase [Solirubrobacteraceae bacterium]|nr:DHH family phosphoesterase [Solirubrobacteraceae bacterium]